MRISLPAGAADRNGRTADFAKIVEIREIAEIGRTLAKCQHGPLSRPRSACFPGQANLFGKTHNADNRLTTQRCPYPDSENVG